MNDVLGHYFVLQGYKGEGTTWTDGMNFGMNIVPGAGLITRPLDLRAKRYHCATTNPYNTEISMHPDYQYIQYKFTQIDNYNEILK